MLNIPTSLLIKILLDLPMMIIGLFVVPFGLRYGFKGILWPWGNDDHPDNGGNFWRKNCGESWWCAYQWFALRNPTFNFGKYVLGHELNKDAYRTSGTLEPIGDTKGAGWYWATDDEAWEFYLIKPYLNKCVRVRIGWKLDGRKAGEIAAFVFAVSLFKSFTGKNNND